MKKTDHHILKKIYDAARIFLAAAAFLAAAHAGAAAAGDAEILKMAREGKITFKFIKELETKDLALVKGYARWASTATKYFEIYHGTGEIDLKTASEVSKKIDVVHEMFRDNFGFCAAPPVKCYIYPYGDDEINALCSANSQSFNDANAMALNLKNRRQPLDIDELMLTIAHEYTHIASIRLAGRKSYEPIFSEGLASFVECRLSGYSWKNYDFEYLRGRLAGFKPERWRYYDDWAKFYACPDFFTLSLSVYYYLDQKYGREKLLKFVSCYFGENRTYDESIMKTYALTADQINDGWLEFYRLN